ncbi:MAG TPA: helix-turn-helix transcriptional regulator, partial [Nocardioides sp.]|nr:helix-turn-helix transcriptional regulator [Nocardioides sp.]
MSTPSVLERPLLLPAATLREMRVRRALAPDDVAQRLGVHPATVLRWERGERLPGPTHVVGIARILGLGTAEVAATFDPWRGGSTEQDAIVGCGLRDLRRAAGVPVSRLAEVAGVRPSTVYNWEHGRARIPLTVLPALAGALGTNLDRLRAGLAGAGRWRPAEVDSPLRRLRRRTGLSQAQVGSRIGAHRHSVGCWERGQCPPLHMLRRLAEVYGVTVSVVARSAAAEAPAELDPRSWSAERAPAVLRVLRE